MVKVTFLLSYCIVIFVVILLCKKPRMLENEDHGNVKVGCNNKMQNKNKLRTISILMIRLFSVATPVAIKVLFGWAILLARLHCYCILRNALLFPRSLQRFLHLQVEQLLNLITFVTNQCSYKLQIYTRWVISRSKIWTVFLIQYTIINK